MTNNRITNFLNKNNLEPAPIYKKKKEEECYEKRKYSSPLYTFHDTNGIKHYIYKNKDYRKKILLIEIDFDERKHELPSSRRISYLKNIIRTYITKPRIITEKSHDNIIIYELLFTANNTIKSFQYWMDELAFQLSDNSTIQLKEISLNICTHEKYNKIIPEKRAYPNENNHIEPVNKNINKLNDFELASIGSSYQKSDRLLPPHDLAVELGFDENFFEDNKEYYEDEDKNYAINFLEQVMHSKIIK